MNAIFCVLVSLMVVSGTSDNLVKWFNDVDVGHSKVKVSSEGVFALTNIKEGEIISSIPISSMLIASQDVDLAKTLDVEENRRVVDGYIALGIYLLKEKEKGNASRWHVYLSSMIPSSYQTCTYWDEEDLEELKGSPLYAATKERLELIEQVYNHILPFLTEKNKIFTPEVLTLDNLKHILTFVWSRSRDLMLREDTTVPTIIPIASEMRISSAPTKIQLVAEDNHIYIRALSSIKTGEELTVNPGPVPNSHLLLTYGVSLPNNIFNAVPLVSELSVTDPFFEAKGRMLGTAKISPTFTHFMINNGTGVPESLLATMRIQALRFGAQEFNSWQNALQGKVVSARNEWEVSRYLLSALTSMLKQYPTSYEEDTLLLQTPEDLSPAAIDAITLRREEKGMLLEAREIVKARWLNLLLDTDTYKDLQ